MRFIIKEISPSATEVRIAVDSVTIANSAHYILGGIGGSFDEGTIDSKYIPHSLSNFVSAGPNPGVIRLLVAYLKDTLGTPSGFKDTVFIVDDIEYPIVNIAIDDINLISLTKETIPSFVVKLGEPLPLTIAPLSEASIEKQVLTTQEQDVYYIPKPDIPLTVHGLDYDAAMKDEVINPDAKFTNYQNWNDLTSSVAPVDTTIYAEVLSGSDSNLRVDYSKFENHTHFGSAVYKIENFKKKVSTIEDYLIQI